MAKRIALVVALALVAVSAQTLILLATLRSGLTEQRGAVEDWTRAVQAQLSGELKAGLDAVHADVLTRVADGLSTSKEDFAELARRIAARKGPRLTAAKTAFEKAEEQWSKGNSEEAGWYYYSAIEQDPENTAYLKQYVGRMIEWCQRHLQGGDAALAYDTARQLGLFLDNRIGTMPPEDVPVWIDLRDQLRRCRSSIEQDLQKRQQEEQQAAQKETAEEATKLAGMPEPETSAELDQQERDLADVAMRLQGYEGTDFPKLAELQRRVADRIETLQSLRARDNVSLLLSSARQQFNTMKQRSFKGEPDDSYDVLAYQLRVMDQLICALAVRPDPEALSEAAAEVASFSKEVLEFRQAQEWERLHSTVTDALKQADEAWAVAVTTPQRRYEDAVTLLVRAGDLIQDKWGEVQDVEFRRRLRELSKNINDKVLGLRQKQRVVYQKWAIEQCRELHTGAKEKALSWGGLKVNKALARDMLVQYLGPVDTALLGRDAGACYDEVFRFVYGRLDELQIDASASMVVTPKKTYTDF